MDWQSLLKTLNLQLSETPALIIFAVFLVLALVAGRFTPAIVRFGVRRFSPEQVSHLYDNLIEPLRGALQWAGTLVLISWAMVWIEADYANAYKFFSPFIDLAVIASVAWLVSRLFRQTARIYGVNLVKRLGREVDEMLLVVETIINVVIGLVAVLIFAQSQKFNLVGLFASLGVGGLAIAFAAQKILEQLLSTIVLYLDRPFIPGEYIRMTNGQLGRVESIGLRSTKIRTAAKSTLLIVPNSNLISMEIENVSRAKKVMVLLHLDFKRPLREEDAALVKQVITQSTDSVFGVDPGSTSIVFSPTGETETQQDGRKTQRRQARVTFFILGSNESSIVLRKRLLEYANETIAKRLEDYNIRFTMEEPTVYVESPVTL